MSWDEFRERANVWLYSSKERVLAGFKIANLLVSSAALVVLSFYYGFPHDSETAGFLLNIVRASFGFYVLHYVTKILYDFQPIELIRRTWFEAAVMVLLLVEGFSEIFTGELLIARLFEGFGVSGARDITTLFVQIYFFTVVFAELIRGGNVLPRIRLNPALIFILSFLGIISIGTGLLMLPEMTTVAGGMGFLDALFTSTSATCVTGLMVEDTPTFFTYKGQFVILVLIQLGGLNLIAFGSFLAVIARFGVGVMQHDVIEDFVNRDNFLSGTGMLGKVLRWCAGIELLGAVGMFLSWSPNVQFDSLGDKVFSSIFHSISAFNNAGISLFTNGLAAPEVADNWMMHWMITILVFFGALGMMAIFDLFDPGKLRERMRAPWKQIGLPTKIALYFSTGLVVVGAVAYYFLEQQGTLAGMDLFGAITTSVFQSATRTSGFNTVDIGAVGVPMLFLLTILMFIGSSSSSTGGGIKTSTFSIVLADVWRTIRGFDHVQLFKRTIPEILRARAYSVLLFFLVGNTIAIFALSISEAHILAMPGRGILDLIFEEVSAFGTVGLSTGITADLSAFGKMVIIASMFVGRVGTLTVAFAIGGRLKKQRVRYPEGHTMVG